MGDVLTFDRTSAVGPQEGAVEVKVQNVVFGGGNGGSGMVPSVPMKEYVDSRSDAIESRLSEKLSKLPTTNTVWGATAAIIAGIFTAVTIVLASVSMAGDRFDGGMSVSPIIAEVQQKQVATDKEQDTKLQLMDDKLDLILKQTASK
jgi:hypothetical protein